MNYELKRGDKGQEVSRLQSRLNDTTLTVVVDGDFGPATQAAVTSFQKSDGLSPTGRAGQDTLTALSMPVVGGIDVSHHNGAISWTPESHLPRFAYLKATEGRTHKDTRFIENEGLCQQLGIHYGFYHYARPDTDVGIDDARQEARFFAQFIGEATLRPVLDLEAGMKTDNQYNVDWALTFREELVRLTGKDPILYSAKWYHDTYLRKASDCTLSELQTMDLWVASYNKGSAPDRMVPGWERWLMWQWTGEGATAGIRGDVDQNWVAGGMFERLLG